MSIPTHDAAGNQIPTPAEWFAKDEGRDPRSQIYQHVRTGGLYFVEAWDAKIEATLEEAVVYRNLETGQLWVRPRAEFTDGRFKCVSRDRIEQWKP